MRRFLVITIAVLLGLTIMATPVFGKRRHRPFPGKRGGSVYCTMHCITKRTCNKKGKCKVCLYCNTATKRGCRMKKSSCYREYR